MSLHDQFLSLLLNLFISVILVTRNIEYVSILLFLIQLLIKHSLSHREKSYSFHLLKIEQYSSEREAKTILTLIWKKICTVVFFNILIRSLTTVVSHLNRKQVSAYSCCFSHSHFISLLMNLLIFVFLQ